MVLIVDDQEYFGALDCRSSDSAFTYIMDTVILLKAIVLIAMSI